MFRRACNAWRFQASQVSVTDFSFLVAIRVFISTSSNVILQLPRDGLIGLHNFRPA